MKLQVNDGSSVEVSEEIFGCEFNEGLVHQVVTAYMAGGRQGSKAQKTRAQVSGGGAKPWKQKGTGRARAGTSRGPLWRGGGATFAAVNRDFSQKVNRKTYRKGIKVILSELVRQDRLILKNDVSLSAPKTKELVNYLKELNLTNVLIVSAAEDLSLLLASRNLPHVAVCDYTQLDPLSLVSFEKVLFSVEALQKLESKLA